MLSSPTILGAREKGSICSRKFFDFQHGNREMVCALSFSGAADDSSKCLALPEIAVLMVSHPSSVASASRISSGSIAEVEDKREEHHSAFLNYFNSDCVRESSKFFFSGVLDFSQEQKKSLVAPLLFPAFKLSFKFWKSSSV